MAGSIKRNYRTEFPTIGVVLTLEVGFDGVATITASRSDNAKLLRLKKFTDYNEAMDYYSELYNHIKSEKSLK